MNATPAQIRQWLPKSIIDMPWKNQIIQPGLLLPDLDESPVMCLDFETKPRPEFASRDGAGLHPKTAEILGICAAVPGHSWYIPMRHRAPGSENWNIDPDMAMLWLRDTVANKKLIINQHEKFDAKHGKENGGCHETNVDILKHAPNAFLFCTMIGSQLIDERWFTHSLKPVCERVLGIPATEAKIISNMCRDAGQKKDRIDYSIVPADIMGKYGCKDGELPLRLGAWQVLEFDKQNLWQAFLLEMRTLETLIKSETRGFRVDRELLAIDNLRVSTRALELEEQLHKEAGVTFNPNSAEEIADIVDTLFGLKVKKVFDKKKKIMKVKVDDDILQEYIIDYPERASFFFRIRMVRRLRHLMTSFIDAFRYWQFDGIVYPNFHQLSPNAATRMSSSDPNTQNWSSLEEWELPESMSSDSLPRLEKSEVYTNKEGVTCWKALGARQYVVPREDHALLLFDQSQIEYRLFTHYANNPRMIAAYHNDPNLDLHEWARVEIFKGRIKRRPAKNVHFGIVYGMGKAKTAKSMLTAGARITIEEATQILDDYHAQVPEVKLITKGEGGVSKTLERRGYLTSILGGRRRLAEHWDYTREELEEMEISEKGALPYQGLNIICQRGSMDVLKHTVNAADDAGYNPLVLIHDEGAWEPHKDQVQEWAWNLKKILQQFNKPDGTPYLKVPIYVAGKYTDTRWSEAEKIEFEETPNAQVEVKA